MSFHEVFLILDFLLKFELNTDYLKKSNAYKIVISKFLSLAYILRQIEKN